MVVRKSSPKTVREIADELRKPDGERVLIAYEMGHIVRARLESALTELTDGFIWIIKVTSRLFEVEYLPYDELECKKENKPDADDLGGNWRQIRHDQIGSPAIYA